MSMADLRRELFQTCLKLPPANLATGSTGNLSARDPESGHILIKRSGVPYADMTENDFVEVTLDGAVLNTEKAGKPSFETPTHLALYRAFPEIGAVLHTHIPAAIVLSASRDAIESNLTPTGRRLLLHPLPVMPFVENGTDDMAEKVVSLMKGNVGVVIRNHGPFIIGDNARHVFDRTVALRDVCELYYAMLLVGKPSLIPPAGRA